MKYIKLYEKFEDWNTVSDADLANVQELHEIGVVSSQELAELKKLMATEQRIIKYNGVGSLNLARCTLLKSLPAGLEVGGDLILNWCTGLESLPDELTVSGDLSLYGCTGLRSLPQGLIVGGDLFLAGSLAGRSGLVVDGDLTLGGCLGLESLPAGLKIGGKIYR
jgi:hypothetical protein